MSFFNLFNKSSKKTFDDLIKSNNPIKMEHLLELNEINSRSEIVTAAIKLLHSTNHARDGYNILGPLAAEGDMNAQIVMGEFCEEALGKFDQAAIWYQRAAEQGMAKAQRNYADMLMTGKGITCDRKKAFVWYNKAAEQGIAEAQFVLGEFYRNGMDIQKDLEKAKYWYEKAKNNGFSHATNRLRQIEEMR